MGKKAETVKNIFLFPVFIVGVFVGGLVLVMILLVFGAILVFLI